MRENNYEWYDDYLNHLLTEDELVTFNSKLKNDFLFKEDFLVYQETFEMLNLEFTGAKNTFKNNLKNIAQNQRIKEKPKVIFFNPKWIAIAATITVVISIIFFQNNSLEYSDYSQFPEAAFVERNDENKNLIEAQNLFNKKKYKEAILAFEKIDFKNEYEMKLYYAMALTADNQFNKADDLLENIIKSNEYYKATAQYYLGLSKLKQNDLKSCKIILSKIDISNENYKKAQEIIKKID
jgi:hypothetical protein